MIVLYLNYKISRVKDAWILVTADSMMAGEPITASVVLHQ